jgi:hypothetical protein
MIGRVAMALAVAATLTCAAIPAPARAAEGTSPPDLTGQWRLDPKRSDTMRPMSGGGERGRRGGMPGGGPGGGGPGGGGFPGGGGGFPGGGPGGGGGFSGGGPGGGQGGFGRGGPGGGGQDGENGPPSGDEQSSGNADDSGTRRARGGRPVRLPDLMHVTQTDQIVSFEDSTGTVLQEITTIGAARDTLLHSPGASVMAGAWVGDTLVVRNDGPRGMKMTQTITFDARNDLLVLRTKMEPPAGQSNSESGSMPAREFKRVYARVKE